MGFQKGALKFKIDSKTEYATYNWKRTNDKSFLVELHTGFLNGENLIDNLIEYHYLDIKNIAKRFLK